MDLIDVLKIDKDCFVDTRLNAEYIQTVIETCRKRGIKVLWIKCTRTRHGMHFYIKITPEAQPELANRLQFLLGDDTRRVDFNRARIRSGLNEWNLLFERASVKLRTIYHASRFWPEQQLKRGESNGQRINRV